MAAATRLVIQQLTGSQRSIELGGWAGPRRGVSFGVEMKSKKTTYGGNRRGSIQVINPDWLDTPINGAWRDHLLVNGQAVVQAVGFPDLQSSPWPSTALVAAFYSLCASGNALRVSWYNEVREGIMKRFVPHYGVPTGVDVEWEAEFEWNADDVGDPQPAVAAPAQQDPRSEMRQEMTATDRSASRRPSVVIPDVAGYVSDGLTATRIAAGTCFDGFRTIAQTVTTAQLPAALTPPVSSIVAATGTLVDELEVEWRQVQDRPRTELTISDVITDLIATEAWRLDLAYRQEVLRNGSMRRAREAAARLVPGTLLFITAAIGTSLRQLSMTYYGTSDAWQRIADANGIPYGVLQRTMVIVIPLTGV